MHLRPDIGCYGVRQEQTLNIDRLYLGDFDSQEMKLTESGETDEAESNKL
jgi:hypothetical protein